MEYLHSLYQDVLDQGLKVVKRYGSSLKFVAVFLFFYLLYKAAFFLIWRSDHLFSLYYDFSLFWIDGLLSASGYLLGGIGYEIELIEALRIVKIKGTSGVTVGEPCIGFDIMALFFGLIFSSTLPLAKKISHFLGAMLIINSLNVLRISALAVLVQYDPYLWELNHKFIFTIVVYLVMFLFWFKMMNSTSR